MGLLKNPTQVSLNEVKGLLTLVESSSRRFFAALRMTKGGLLQQPRSHPVFWPESRRYDITERDRNTRSSLADAWTAVLPSAQAVAAATGHE